ncbi:EamA family transporter [Kinneretia aquatilis]|uniref:EamA family transporter n=1 Tax=Kinneretia aquatilis TaxID=2070761 RepID=UPI00149534BD|nr:EamA family transporter [Paucibacter aquatile]WIV97208.1 EamA family transporter [Paucibacter aquatile]
MSPLALALVLAAAICHASWNLIAKRSGGGGNEFVLMSSILVGLVWAPVVAWTGVEGVATWGWLEWTVLAVSAAVHVLYFRCLLHGYSVADLTVVYPLARGSGPLLSSLAAVFVLGESLSWLGAAGALAVVSGVFLIAGGPALLRQLLGRGEAGALSESRAFVRQRLHRGLFWGALTGVFIATYTVIDGYAVKVLLISPILVDYVGNVLRIPVMGPFALRDPARFKAVWRAQWKAALAIAVLGPTSYIMVLYAMQLAPLSHVAPAREVSMLFAALAGGSLLGEGDRWLRLLGAAAIALGVAGLALG